MLRYHVAFHMPHQPGEMVVAEALDCPGAVSQGFDLQDARLMIASALEDLAQLLLEEGRPLPLPSEDAPRQTLTSLNSCHYRFKREACPGEAARVAGPLAIHGCAIASDGDRYTIF